MERFKACEKEIKTKAFSKEGLSAATKLDPREKEKMELCSWITTTVDRISTQVDACEAEIESLQLNVKKSKKMDADKAERNKNLQERVSKHKEHMSKLELILRLLENGVLTNEQVSSIKEDVEYYVDNNEVRSEIDTATLGC